MPDDVDLLGILKPLVFLNIRTSLICLLVHGGENSRLVLSVLEADHVGVFELSRQKIDFCGLAILILLIQDRSINN